MGDKHGSVVHLGERDCSVQRRHQKLIEESPSPALTPSCAREMGEAAVRAGRGDRLRRAPGTIEFLLDGDGSVLLHGDEHPHPGGAPGDRDGDRHRPGEGADPGGGGRAAQRSGANGARLRGHAIECRINAEDPDRNFQPCPGLITAYHPPGGPGVRVDTHVYAGYIVPPYYDSLLAKVIVHGNDREEALARMGQALDSFILEGVTTTIPFLGRVIRHPDFVAGQVDTKFLEREPQLFDPEA